MTRAVLSIGTNMGDRMANLQLALDGLGGRVRAVSAVYSTAPWGGVDQPDFYNATLIVEDEDLDEWGWLRLAQALEEQAHRVRDVRWGPRTLDVDIISCSRIGSDQLGSADAAVASAPILSSDPDLLLPHPRARDRAFVLRPWLDVEPDALLDGVPVASLLAALPAQEQDGVTRVSEKLVAG